MCRILVAGGRSYGSVKKSTPKYRLWSAEKDAEYQTRRLPQILDAAVERLGLTEIVVCGMKGAATLARQWAEAKGIPVIRFDADKSLGKTGEPLAHDRMIAEGKPEIAIVFCGSWEAWDVVRKANAARIRVIRVDPDDPAWK